MTVNQLASLQQVQLFAATQLQSKAAELAACVLLPLVDSPRTVHNAMQAATFSVYCEQQNDAEMGQCPCSCHFHPLD